jgi:hypothetical protein
VPRSEEPDVGSRYFLFFTVHDAVAGLSSTLPAASLANTTKLCRPVFTLKLSGEAQTLNGWPSRLHLNVAPASEENVKVAFFDPFFGFPVSAVWGAVLSVAGGQAPAWTD